METSLTSEGRRFAESNAESSIVARIALAADAGAAHDWPVQHRKTAVEACNAMGRENS